MLSCTSSTQARAGELVVVTARPGIVDPFPKPPGSVVGIESFSNLPHTENFSLKVWSMRTISWRLSKRLRSEKKPAVVLVASRGNLPKMSLMYSAEIGLICDAGICVVVAVQVAEFDVHTGVEKVPWS